VEAKVVRLLGAVVGCTVVALALVNAWRGEWGIAFAGMVLAAGIATVVAELPPPGRR